VLKYPKNIYNVCLFCFKYMIAITIGTRAELIKTVPVMLELNKRKIPYTFIHTGQHNLGDFCEDFGIRGPDITLTEPPKGTTKFWVKTAKALSWAFIIIFKIRSALKKIKNLEYVIYHGDTMNTVASAIASSRYLNPLKKWKNIHLEAGLRSGSFKEPFPEEISRRLTTLFTDIHFSPSFTATRNLGKRKGVYDVGNTGVDMAYIGDKLAKKRRIKTPKTKYTLCTLHRHENLKSKERLSSCVDIILSSPYPIYWALHEKTQIQMKEFGLWNKVKRSKKINILPIITYVEFNKWLKDCTLLITDGGSVQEESLAFKKPCFIIRKRTERIAGLETGINLLTELEVKKTKELMKTMKKFKLPKFKNPYGDGTSAKKIVDIMTKKSLS